MKRRNLRAGVLILSAVLLIFSSAGASEHPITFAGDKSFPPVEYLEEDVPKGLNIDLLNELSKAMGRKFDIRLMPWADAQQKVLDGEVDAITTMSITEQRKELYDFSDITLRYRYSIFVGTDQVGIRTPADLEGKTVGVTKGGGPRQILESNPKIKLVIIEDYLEGFRLLLSRELDAVGADRWVGAYTLRNNSIRGITIRGEPFAERLAGIAVKKGNTELLNEINQGINKLKETGTIKEIEDKWEPKEVLFLTREEIHAAIIYAGFALLIALVGAACFWIVSLKRRVRLKTRELTTANRRLRENIAELDSEIFERKRAEAELQHYMDRLKESNQALHEFAYVASHDLQEPLRIISGYLQILERRYKGSLDADADKCISRGIEGVNRMKTLIQDLLTYSRVGTRGKPFEPLSMEEALETALSNLEAAIEEAGAMITHDPLPTICADSTQMVQLFQNLIGNAVKFHGEDTPRIHVGCCSNPQPAWLFSVRDNGIGIEPEYAERIFGIFQRLHTRDEYPGTGIGLAVCKKIVERHGGSIRVDSELGKGSTFHFTIAGERKEGFSR